MKQKIIALSKAVLVASMAFSWWVGSDVISLFLLGEYAYPNESEY